MTLGSCEDSLELLLLADVHYVRHAQHQCAIPERRAAWGLELVRRALLRARREGRLDAMVLMGDLVDSGNARGAEQDLAELREEARSQSVPVIVVPGNHDGDPSRLLQLLGDAPGVHEIKGHRLVTFADAYQPNDEAARSEQDLGLLASLARGPSARPPIVFQHNPVHPPLESSYPYNLTNAPRVMAAYEQAGVTLSVSAHYHPGIAAQRVNGVTYLTCPALCEAPFGFLRLSLRGGEFAVTEERLALEAPTPLFDCHVHTQYAYCRDDVTAAEAILRARAFGVERICLTEHAGQLYLSGDDYWSHRFGEDAGLIARERAAGRGRMAQFREELTPLRSATVGLGLEVELDAAGKLTLLDEDREGWDLLIGAVHVLPERRRGAGDPAQLAREFMDHSERLCAQGVDILAHPFRFFRRAQLPVPTELFEPLAQLLASTGVAAEINYHTNEPDPRFFDRCLHHGVKIALGSDAHGLWEVGEFAPHLGLLRRIVSEEEMGEVLYRSRSCSGRNAFSPAPAA